MTTNTTRYQWRSDGNPAGHMNYCAYPSHPPSAGCAAVGEWQTGNSEAWVKDHPESTKIGIGDKLANGATVLAVKPYSQHPEDGVVFLAQWSREFATWVGTPDGTDTYWGNYSPDINSAVIDFNGRGVAR